MSAPQATVRAALRGSAQPLGRTTSAIDKRPVAGPVEDWSLLDPLGCAPNQVLAAT